MSVCLFYYILNKTLLSNSAIGFFKQKYKINSRKKFNISYL